MNLLLKNEKKKRERKKCKRRKTTLTSADLSSLSEINGKYAVWDVPDVKTILHTNRHIKPNICRQLLKWKNYSLQVLESLITLQCVKLLTKTNVEVFLNLTSKVQQFCRNFSRIRFRRILNDHVSKYSNKKSSHLISHPLSRTQFIAYTYKIFTLLLPKYELIDHRNLDVFCINIVDAFSKLRTCGSVILPNELFKEIRFNRINWLDGVPFKLKEAIVYNLLKSLFEIFTSVFTSHFYTTENYKNSIVHYRRDVWRRITQESFDLLRAERKLVSLITSSSDKCIHTIRFLPKETSTRPIVVLHDSKVKQELNEVRALLRYLMARNPNLYGWGISNIQLFQFSYRQLLLKHKHEHPNQVLHFCTADIQNCYTSLDHAFLEQLLHKLIPTRSNYTVVQAKIHNAQHNYNVLRTLAGKNYTEACAQLMCKRNERIVDNIMVQQITGAELLDRVCRYTMQTVVLAPITIAGHERLFKCGRGITQGNQLSVVLCQLYLGAMERLAFPDRPKELFCRRYMDDYVMISYKKEYIEQVMERLLAEADKTGILFGKLVTSFRNTKFFKKRTGNSRVLRTKEKLQWCGLALNTRTLTIATDYRRYRRRHLNISFPKLHPSDYYTWICKATMRALKGRLMALRNCDRVWPAKRRLVLRREFCTFAHSHYLKYFVHQLGLKSGDPTIRIFLNQMMSWIFKCFSSDSIPHSTQF